jgi:DNA repair protein RadC
VNATVAAASAPRLPRAGSPHEREAPDRLDDRALLALGLGGRPRGRRAAALALEAHGLEAWARLPVIECLAEAHRLLDAEDAARLAALLELARRALGPPPGLELSRPEDVVSLLHEWRHETREHFLAFYLNARNQLLVRDLVSVGSLSASIVHPREVFGPAVLRRAAGVIVAHNHPSGDPEPSPEDMAITRRLTDAGALLGIELLDHVVVAARGFVSIKARGGL